MWLLVAWVVLQVMMGWLAGGQGYLLATPAHIGGFAAGCCCSGRCCCGATGRLRSAGCFGRAMPVAVRLEQPVEVDDDIFHLGIVDRALGLAAPGVLGRGIAVVEADQVDRVRGRSRGRAGP